MRASTIDDNVVHGYSYNNIVEIFKNICTSDLLPDLEGVVLIFQICFKFVAYFQSDAII